MTVEALTIGVSGALISLLLGVVAYFLHKTIERFDKLSDSHNEFALNLNTVVMELKSFREDVVEAKKLSSKVEVLEHRISLCKHSRGSQYPKQ